MTERCSIATGAVLGLAAGALVWLPVAAWLVVG